jgi:hypothetical protein
MPVPKKKPGQLSARDNVQIGYAFDPTPAPPPPNVDDADVGDFPDLPELPAADTVTDSEDDLPDVPPALPVPQSSHQADLCAPSADNAQPEHTLATDVIPPAEHENKEASSVDSENEKVCQSNGAEVEAKGTDDFREVSMPSLSSTARHDDLKVAEHLAKTRGLPPEARPMESLRFLSNIGYEGFQRHGHIVWRNPVEQQPELTITVNSHIEFGDHTQYAFVCKVNPRQGSSSSETSWKTLRRLKHLRSGVHDPVRRALGTRYKHYFGDTPFALHTAPAGTTARLHAWFGSVAKCINSAALPPMLVASTLRVLDAPGTPLCSEGKYSFRLSRDFDQIPVTAAMYGSKHDVTQLEQQERVMKTPRPTTGTRLPRNTSGPSSGGYKTSTHAAAYAAPSQYLEQAGGRERTCADWINNQAQFAHLPPLPEGWMRVRSRTTGAIYYCNTETYETTFEEPTQAQAVKPRVVPRSDLPPNWVQMISRTTGQRYFWNCVTDKSQFEEPTH